MGSAESGKEPAQTQDFLGRGATAFSHPLSVTAPDPDHAAEEDRYIIVGMSNRLRLLIVAFAERGDRIGIISARQLTRIERKAYEEAMPDRDG